VIEMARKLKSKWLSKDQIETIKGFGRRFKMTQRSGVIDNRVWETGMRTTATPTPRPT
jgi:hypothetical protein